MDPSEEKREKKTPAPKKRSFVLPAVLLITLLASIGGIYAFLQSSSPPPLAVPEPVIEEEPAVAEPSSEEPKQEKAVVPEIVNEDPVITPPEEPDAFDTVLPVETDAAENNTESVADQSAVLPESVVQETVSKAIEEPKEPEQIVTVCTEPSKRLDAFYKHLDKQAYIQAYKLSENSDLHFEKLIEKLLANPPKVTRESDDLYTILRNTAHFFRISGKDNILMLKGILNSEKDSLEQILADYFFLITTPECIHDRYARNINGDALYEYACFFLNTMGGRLYLFRRDSQSRMVVTYYAILLVDLANRQQNNRHGIALKPAIDMLISEMETGGSNMKGSEDYLDVLYDLKESYQ